MAVISTRTKRYMEAKLRAEERREERERTNAGERFLRKCPPLLVKFQGEGKLPSGIKISLPHDAAVGAIWRGRSVALPVGSFDAVPDLEISDEQGRFESEGLSVLFAD
jgi:hypothetical protein